MSKISKKAPEMIETLVLFRRSLIYQTKEFFNNSTLHGVRYIAESGRPFGEKFMWFCFTVTGAVAALVIIMSLWEKFQTNPTITGLDTDFHNQQIIFPTTVVCPINAFDNVSVMDVAYKELGQYEEEEAKLFEPFLKILTQLSFDNMQDAYDISLNFSASALGQKTLRSLAFQVKISCEDTLEYCKYRDEEVKCCPHFDPVYTEHGFCYAFNSKFKSREDADEPALEFHDLFETDKKWALYFLPKTKSKIYVHSHKEYFGWDYGSQLTWDNNQAAELLISMKQTYTTEDARQLSIGQRKCIFPNEIKLEYYNDEYTFSGCMKECRMKKCARLCKCIPPFFKPLRNTPYCKVDQLACLAKYKDNITNIRDCYQCELSCSKTVYDIEKLNKNYEKNDKFYVNIEYLTWPIIRYKREVLFGWVDLLVSFGGIAGLFLGFSLLSGVEIIYYFTMRACCMVYKNREELQAIEEEIRKTPLPRYNISLRARGNHRRSSSLPPNLGRVAKEKTIQPKRTTKVVPITVVTPNVQLNNRGLIKSRRKNFSKPTFKDVKASQVAQAKYLDQMFRSKSEPNEFFYLP